MSRFRPCIDLHGNQVKQIVGSSLCDGHPEQLKTNFVADRPPEYFAELYRADALEGGHVIKLGPGNDQAALAALAAWPGHLQLGGAVTDENAKFWLEHGAGKVIVTSFVFRDGKIDFSNLERLGAVVPPEKLVLDLSCRKVGTEYFVATDRWQKISKSRIDEDLFDRLSPFASEFLVHAVDVEGNCRGIDERLAGMLADLSALPVVYAGGIDSFAAIDALDRASGGRVDFTIGSALDIFGGSLRYQEVVAYVRDREGTHKAARVGGEVSS
ncbi:MAG: phosphoribosylformimino-5-aminoimidazole carboxamide ribotide isomerase [Victivallaceae bacterium]|nr:phosphoribosylformimino-5-aminoimidazole carboxamide ribotide isomerase [Victivallaceae bacterium]